MAGLSSCLILILLLTVIGAWIFVRASGKKSSQVSAHGPVKRSRPGWQNWIGYIAVALILSLWSIFAGLFFLAVVWILRQDPNPDSTFDIGNEEKKTARRVYTWLFFSPLLTIPVFLIALVFLYFNDSSNNYLVLAALTPLLFHLPLLLGLTSKSAFVYRHTQQGILLIALRAGLAAAAITIGHDPEDGIWLFLFGNGSLWLFGSLWGWVEVKHGNCWLMKQKADTVPLGQGKSPPPEIHPQPNLSPEKYMEYSKLHLKHQRKTAAKEYALKAFRHGNFETRRQAVQVLDELNEIGFF